MKIDHSENNLQTAASNGNDSACPRESSLSILSNSDLTEELRKLSIRERKVTAELIVHVAEFMRRRLYLEYGCTSIYGYLTTKLNYAGSTAQNRIDAATLLLNAPQLESDLANGKINLAQVTIVARGLRQADTGNAKTVGLLTAIRNLDTRDSAIIVARELDLKLKPSEKLRHQKDESVVLEVTLSREQMDALKRAKEVASHVLPKGSWAEVIAFLTEDYLKRKDLTREKPLRKKAKAISATSVSDAAKSQLPARRKPLPVFVRREIAKRDDGCQHVDLDTGEICQSRYQLQFDHIRSLSSGGKDDLSNIQRLCGIHNRMKYQRFG